LQPLFIAQQDRVPIAPSFDVQPLLRTRQRSSELWPVMRVCAISGRDRPSARSLGVKRYIVMATVNRPYPADRREFAGGRPREFGQKPKRAAPSF
jgi:hypothetical protein